MVSIHARTRRATAGLLPNCCGAGGFQSTPAHGGRPGPGRSSRIGSWSFNPRPHTAGDSTALTDDQRDAWFQSTPAHGGRRGQGDQPCPSSLVSIHARTRRATPALPTAEWFYDVSIHARTRRATWCSASYRVWMRCFNPRPHTAGDTPATLPAYRDRLFQSTPAHGGRPCLCDPAMRCRPVSIHARTRRATN